MKSEPTSSAGQRPVVYLIDGSAYIYRAFHAIRGLANSKGMPTNAVFGFTRMLIKLMEERKPEYVGMFFDAKGPTFRHDMYAAYKANRPAMPAELSLQIPYIKKVTAGFRITVIEHSGYEADDLIGSIARQAVAHGFDVVMVTGDKDFMQLIDSNTAIWDPMKDLSTDLAAIERNFCLSPSQLIDMMGLTGDSSDNVPGVPGIGPKTALKLIQTFGSLQEIYDRIGEVTSGKQRDNLLQHREQAFLSRRLVTIDTAAPVAFDPSAMKTCPPDASALEGLFQELEFRQLQHEYQQKRPKRETRYAAILDSGDLDALVQRLAASQVFALDTETTSENPMKASLVGISVAIEPFEAFYIPCGHSYLGAPDQLARDEVLARLKPVLENPAIAKIGQNIKYDWMVLKRHGVEVAGFTFDTMLASYLLNPSKRAHNLDQIALDFLSHKTITFSDVAGKGKNALTFDRVTLEQAVPYACEDADVTLRAARVLEPQLRDLGLMPLLHDVELPLVPVLMRMEITGVRLDRQGLHVLSKSFQSQLQTLEEQIHAQAGERFNIQSSQQLGRILFEKLQLPTIKKTKKKTCYSTDVDVLMRLAQTHDLPALILRHRSLAKLKSTYVDALLDLSDPETDRIHTSYNQTVAATGRLSSSDPNLQNIPIRTEEGRQIRKAFIARPGWLLLSADYSQIELRLLAHVADDPILIEAFAKDEDIHARTASEVFQIPVDSISGDLRRQAKVINFGIIYGMSAFGLSRELGISPKMAQNYIDQYFQHYQGVQAFVDRTIAEARKTHRTATLLGRLRLLADITSANAAVRQFAERMAVNTPIQGSAADLIKLAMIRIDAALRERRMQSAMILTVHDELVFEVPPEELDALKSLATDIMEHVWQLKVPLKVNLAWGPDWAQAH